MRSMRAAIWLDSVVYWRGVSCARISGAMPICEGAESPGVVSSANAAGPHSAAVINASGSASLATADRYAMAAALTPFSRR